MLQKKDIFKVKEKFYVIFLSPQCTSAVNITVGSLKVWESG